MYNEIEDIKKALEPYNLDEEKLYEVSPNANYDELLESYEERTRAMINEEIGGETFEFEENREDELNPSNSRFQQLSYPVQEVKKVERYHKGEWKEISSKRYIPTKFGLKLRRFPRPRDLYSRRIRRMFQRDIEARSYTWNDLAEYLRVTYDRGFEEIPSEVKNLQLELIVRMIQKARTQQNLSVLKPEEIQQAIGVDIITDDIRSRLDKLTHPKGKVRF